MERLTVILVVAVVTILSLVSRIDPEGAISLLSAVVGYVLGRSQSLMAERTKKPQRDTPPLEEEDTD